MFVRFTLLAFTAAIVGAAPITIEFIGVGSGTVGTTSFVDQSFSFVFNTDTSNLMYGPSSEPTDWTTLPAFTTAYFNTGSITNDLVGGSVAVFSHPNPEDRVGIWQYNDVDWLTLTDGPTGSPDTSPLANYNLQSNLSLTLPASAVTLVGTLENNPLPTADGNLQFTSFDGATVTFSAQITTPTPPITTTTVTSTSLSTVPEPSTFTLLLLGGGGILAGSIRRRSSR